jgi:putative transposase
MARTPRLALAGELHYLLLLGHNRQPVFADDPDREAYLAILRESAAHCRVAIHAYALLESEIHLLATPSESGALGRLMQSIGRRYVGAFNRRHSRSGSLWQGRFRTAVIDGATLGHDATLQVECQPVLAGLVAVASDWPWSSAAHHLGRRRDPLIAEHTSYWTLGNTPFEREHAHAYSLGEGPKAVVAAAIERAVRQGRPVGGERFLQQVEVRTGRPTRVRPRGRPPHLAEQA